MKKEYLFVAIFIYIGSILFLAITTPITPHEAKIFYQDNLLSTLMHYGQSIIDGFLGLRLFFILFGLVSIYLFYCLSQIFFEKTKDVYIATAIFIFLPGILTASTLVNIAIVTLPLVMLFLLMYEKENFWILPFIMGLLLIIHQTSMIFFIALFLFSIASKEKKLFFLSLFFLILSIIFEKGVEIGGRPSGHFLEIFGLYASIFSPLLFLYFFYAMLRTLVTGEKTLLWYISFTALVFSLLLSIRQRVYIADFAPYVMISIIVMLDVFNRSVAIRLPQFKKKHMFGFYSVMITLVFSAIVIIFHQLSFYMMGTDSNHFAKRIYRPYLLAKKLKEKEIKCYDNVKGKAKYQLRYYGIDSCQN